MVSDSETHTHTFNRLDTHTPSLSLHAEPEPVQRRVYGSTEGSEREPSLSVELMKPGATSIKEWSELAPFTRLRPSHGA